MLRLFVANGVFPLQSFQIGELQAFTNMKDFQICKCQRKLKYNIYK